MRRRLLPRRPVASELGFALMLTAAWVLFWGDLHPANVATGFVAAAVLLLIFPLGHDVEHVRHRFRPLAAIRLLLAFSWQLVTSNLVVARDILIGRSQERPGVVACPLRVGAPGLLTLLANMIALSPGTMPIDVEEDPPILYLHLLRLEDPELVRAQVARLEELAVAVLGDRDALAAVSVPPPRPPHLRTGGAP